MHFLPEDPLVYESAREAIMNTRGASIRTLFALESVLAELAVDPSSATDEDFHRALESARDRGTFAPSSAVALMMPGLMDYGRALTSEGLETLRSLALA